MFSQKSNTFAFMTKRVYFCLLTALTALQLVSCGDSDKKVSNIKPDLDSLLVLYPDSVPLLIERGNKWLKEYQYEKAMADGAKAFRLDSNNVEARILYADLLNNRPEKTQTDISFAQRHYKVVIKKQPKNVRALIGLAGTYKLQQNFDMSFKYVNEVLRIDPKYRDAYILKGSNYMLLGMKDNAISSFETAIQQDPEFYEAYLFLGIVYQGDSNAVCLEYLTTAHELQPKNMEITYVLASAKEQFKKTDDAVKLYREMAKDTSDFYVSRGLFHQGHIHQFRRINLDSAIYYYNSALQTNPMFVEAWHNLGLCYEDKGDRSQALKYYAKALEYDPEFKKSKEAAIRLKP